MSNHGKIIDDVTKALVDSGKPIEAGWALYRHQVLPRECSQAQLDETRKAFFAGAQHLFGSIMTMLDPGTEPTDADLTRMDRIHEELAAFVRSLGS